LCQKRKTRETRLAISPLFFTFFPTLPPLPRESGARGGGRLEIVVEIIIIIVINNPWALLLSSKKKAQVDGHLIQQKQKLAFANNTHTPPLLPHHHPDNFQPPQNSIQNAYFQGEPKGHLRVPLQGWERAVFSQLDLPAGEADMDILSHCVFGSTR
jgi:hypothetical protein